MFVIHIEHLTTWGEQFMCNVNGFCLRIDDILDTYSDSLWYLYKVTKVDML